MRRSEHYPLIPRLPASTPPSDKLVARVYNSLRKWFTTGNRIEKLETSEHYKKWFDTLATMFYTETQTSLIHAESKDVAAQELKILRSYVPTCGDPASRPDLVDPAEVSRGIKQPEAGKYPILKAIECAIHNIFINGDLVDPHVRIREFFSDPIAFSNGVYGIVATAEFHTKVSKARDAFVVKIQKKLDPALGIHEAFIGLMIVNSLRMYVPNFVYTLAFGMCSPSIIFPDHKKSGTVTSFCGGEKNSLGYIVLENLSSTGKVSDLEKLILDKKVGIPEALELLTQAICALMFAYNKVGFVHNDLHPGNLIIRPAASGKGGPFFIRYPSIEEGGQDVYVYSRGNIATIIDLGLSRGEYGGKLYAVTQPDLGHYRRFATARTDINILIGMTLILYVHYNLLDEEDLDFLLGMLLPPVLWPHQMDAKKKTVLEHAKLEETQEACVESINAMHEWRYRMPVLPQARSGFNYLQYITVSLSLAHEKFGGNGKLLFKKSELPKGARILNPITDFDNDKIHSLLEILSQRAPKALKTAPITTMTELLNAAQMSYRTHTASILRDAVLHFDLNKAIDSASIKVAEVDSKMLKNKFLPARISLSEFSSYLDLAITMQDIDRIMNTVAAVLRGTKMFAETSKLRKRFDRLHSVVEIRVSKQSEEIRKKYKPLITMMKEAEKERDAKDKEGRRKINELRRAARLESGDERERLSGEVVNLQNELSAELKKMKKEELLLASIESVCSGYIGQKHKGPKAEVISFANKICLAAGI